MRKRQAGVALKSRQVPMQVLQYKAGQWEAASVGQGGEDQAMQGRQVLHQIKAV